MKASMSRRHASAWPQRRRVAPRARHTPRRPPPRARHTPRRPPRWPLYGSSICRVSVDRSCAAATLHHMEDGTPGVTRPIDVIIADDHAVVRDGIRAVLQREGGEFRVVAEAADIPSMIRVVREHKPDLLTLELTMPGASSLGALPSCFISHPTLAVAILTMREDPEYARQALRAGARSYVLKEAEPAELLQAFRIAVAGGQYLHPRLGALLVTGDGPPGQSAAVLSEREREVVRLI